MARSSAHSLEHLNDACQKEPSEPFVLQKDLRAGFHVFLSVRLENPLRTAFGDLADAARTTHSMRESHVPVSRHLPVAVTDRMKWPVTPATRSR